MCYTGGRIKLFNGIHDIWLWQTTPVPYILKYILYHFPKWCYQVRNVIWKLPFLKKKRTFTNKANIDLEFVWRSNGKDTWDDDYVYILPAAVWCGIYARDWLNFRKLWPPFRKKASVIWKCDVIYPTHICRGRYGDITSSCTVRLPFFAKAALIIMATKMAAIFMLSPCPMLKCRHYIDAQLIWMSSMYLW